MKIKLADRNAALPTWAGFKSTGPKFDRDQIEIPRYAEIETRFRDEAVDTIREFQKGSINRQTAMREFKRNLFKAETESFAAGKRSAGTPVYYVTPGEQKMLAGRHSRNMRYFSKFLRDVETGAGRMSYERRAGMYAESLWSLYNRGQSDIDWDSALAPNARFEWVMDTDAEHCQDCIDRWRMSRDRGGFTWDELVEIGFPGEGTACITHCRCHIRVIHKRVVQEPRIDQATAQSNPNDGVRLLMEITGGTNMPLKVPAAGLPPVKVQPVTVARSINNAREFAVDLARKVPEALQVLVKPDAIREASRSQRVYTGRGLSVEVTRKGKSWEITNIFALGEDGLPLGGAYAVPWMV